jgi:hypothetical protein
VRGPRPEKFGLEPAAAKTRLIPFSRDRAAGRTSFELLGFEFRWGQDRKGKDHLKRRTARKTLRTSLKRFTAWCKEDRHLLRSNRLERCGCGIASEDGAMNDDYRYEIIM